MGQVPAKQFQPQRAIGSSPGNGIVTRSVQAPTLPQNALQPLIQNQIPTVQTANAMPQGGVAGIDIGGARNTDPRLYYSQVQPNPFGGGGYGGMKFFQPGQFNVR
jgi:hypothetical protein